MNYNLSILFISPLLLFVSILLMIGQIQQQVFTETAQSLWSNGTAMPTPRTEVTAATIGHNIYVIGGLDKSGRILDTVEVFNIDNGSWRTVAPLPEGLHHTAASSFNGKIYVIGGSFTTIDEWIPSDKLFIYDPLENKWMNGESMPTARGAMNANFVNGILYVIGGYGTSEILAVNEAYDPSLDKWTSRASMPTPRHHAASAAVGDQLSVIGGRTVGLYPIVNTNINERYDSNQDTGITLEPMLSNRSGISAASPNNTTIYVFGGEDLNKTYDNNEKYDLKSNKWESQEPIPTSRHGLATVSFDDKIYVIGGGPESGLSITGVNEIFNVR